MMYAIRAIAVHEEKIIAAIQCIWQNADAIPISTNTKEVEGVFGPLNSVRY